MARVTSSWKRKTIPNYNVHFVFSCSIVFSFAKDLHSIFWMSQKENCWLIWFASDSSRFCFSSSFAWWHQHCIRTNTKLCETVFCFKLPHHWLFACPSRFLFFSFFFLELGLPNDYSIPAHFYVFWLNWCAGYTNFRFHWNFMSLCRPL